MTLSHVLDTAWIILSFRGARAYDQTIHRIGPAQLAVSIVTVAELYEGVYRAANPALHEQYLLRFLSDKTSLPLTDDICRLFGEHRAELRQRNELIGDLDLLIAVICLHHGLTLLTPNRRHFERVRGLRIQSTPLP